MATMEAILNQIPGGKGAARADTAGNVLEYAGPIDAESVCAVAAMSLHAMDDVGALLGLGGAKGWGIISDQRAMFVHRHLDELVVVESQPTKNPETVLKKLGQSV